MGKSQRVKGQVGERQAVAELRKIGCLTAARRVRNLGGDSDIVDAIPGVSFECKLEKRSAIGPAMRQAVAQARGGEIPAVLHKETLPAGSPPGTPANPWCITVRLSDLPTLLSCYNLTTQKP